MHWLVIGLSLASAFASAVSTTLKKAAANRTARPRKPVRASLVWADPCGWPGWAAT